MVLPGAGGIDGGIELPDGWDKFGEMNDKNRSMTWTINLPVERMHGSVAITIADTLGAGHGHCVPSNLKVQTVRGGTADEH